MSHTLDRLIARHTKFSQDVHPIFFGGPGSGRYPKGSGHASDDIVNHANIYQENPSESRSRSVLTNLAQHTVEGGKHTSLHPGEITVYRSGSISKKGNSFSKSLDVAKKNAFLGEDKIQSLMLKKTDPAIDINKLNPNSRFTDEHEVFVDTRNISKDRYQKVKEEFSVNQTQEYYRYYDYPGHYHLEPYGLSYEEFAYNPEEERDDHGRWVSAGGGEAVPEHIAKLKIPPGWKDVKYNKDPNSDLLVTGKDSKGRTTTIYSDKHWEKSAADKFARVSDLEAKYDKIQKENEAARLSSDPVKAASADCLMMIDKMGIRPGSDKDRGGKVQAYGATTLKGEHVKVDGDKVSLQFVGKKGVNLNLPVDDKKTAEMLIERKKDAGDDGKLFKINEYQLLEHVHSLNGGNFKTKDFRTYLAARTAMTQVDKMTEPKNENEYKRSVMEVAKAVSEKLGNTPVVALQSYIPPQVFVKWKIK